MKVCEVPLFQDGFQISIFKLQDCMRAFQIKVPINRGHQTLSHPDRKRSKYRYGQNKNHQNEIDQTVDKTVKHISSLFNIAVIPGKTQNAAYFGF